MKRNQTYHQTFFMNVKKNVPWHILAPSAVACDMFLLRASAHHWHVSAFLCNKKFQGISYYTKQQPAKSIPHTILAALSAGCALFATFSFLSCSVLLLRISHF